jgi:hypothetical protein
MAFLEVNRGQVSKPRLEKQNRGETPLAQQDPNAPKILHASFSDPEPPASLRFWGLNE